MNVIDKEAIKYFWEEIDQIRQYKQLNWQEIAGPQAKAAANKQWNIPLDKLLKLQNKLGVNLLNLGMETWLAEEDLSATKNPEAPKIMAQIYQLIQKDGWLEDEEIVEKVQQLSKEII